MLISVPVLNFNVWSCVPVLNFNVGSYVQATWPGQKHLALRALIGFDSTQGHKRPPSKHPVLTLMGHGLSMMSYNSLGLTTSTLALIGPVLAFMEFILLVFRLSSRSLMTMMGICMALTAIFV